MKHISDFTKEPYLEVDGSLLLSGIVNRKNALQTEIKTTLSVLSEIDHATFLGLLPLALAHFEEQTARTDLTVEAERVIGLLKRCAALQRALDDLEYEEALYRHGHLYLVTGAHLRRYGIK